MESAFYQLETSIGYRFKDFYGFNGQISATYEQGKNELATEWIDTDALGHQVCFVEFYKCHDFMIDADFSYAFGDILKLETKHELCIERWKDEEANKWVKGNYSTPIFSMDWKADVKLMKGFYLGLDWQYKTFYQDAVCVNGRNINYHRKWPVFYMLHIDFIIVYQTRVTRLVDNFFHITPYRLIFQIYMIVTLYDLLAISRKRY